MMGGVPGPATPQEGGERPGVDYDPDRLVKQFVASFDEIRKRNSELERSNAQLQAALKESTEKLVRAEQSLVAVSRLGRFAAATAAQMLGRALEEVESGRTALRASVDTRRDEARRQALALQTEVFALLEAAQDEATSEMRKSEDRSLDVLRKTRESILKLAGDLDRMGTTSPVEERTEEVSHVAARASELTRLAETHFPQPTSGLQVASAPSRVTGLSSAGPEIGRPASVEPSADIAPASGKSPSGVASTGEICSIEVFASPFDDIASLGRFLQDLKRMPGIVNVKPESFENRTLRLAVESGSSTAPLNALVTLPGFRTRVVSINSERIEVNVLDEGDPGEGTRSR